jgi:hypothetical protein
MKLGTGPPATVSANLKPPAGGAQDAPPRWSERLSALRWSWTEQQWFTGVVAIIGGYAWWEANSFSSRGQWFPLGIAAAITILAAIQFIREGLGAKTGQIMDIGVRSAGAEGARQALFIVLGIIFAMVILMGIITLQWASILVALVGPPVLMRNKTGYIGGAIGGLLIFMVIWQFFGGVFGSSGFVAVIWPDNYILEWFR